MTRLIVILGLFSTFAQGVQGQPPAPQVVDWTIMMFMNAKNNLECAGISNFLQMAKVGSTDRVNFIVELGRPAKHRYTNDEGGWTGVLRFRVLRGMHPVEGSAINSTDSTLRNADMGSGKTLADFVRWAEETYPAKKYMLVIWNHGQGWRFYQSLDGGTRALNVAYRPNSLTLDDEPKPCNGPSGETLTDGVRSVSFDEDTGNFLYNRDIQDSLRGRRLDALGFDACLMGMIESAYAFRDIATVMVASEELVPGDGWNYDLWMGELAEKPDLDGTKLATEIIRSYKETYQDTGETTLSAIDLTRVEGATRELARLSLLVKAKMPTERPILGITRLSFRTFGDWYEGSWQDCQGSKVVRFQSVDLGQFLKLYGRETKDRHIKRQIAQTQQKLKLLVIANYASSLSAGADHWASGLAIYFPSSVLDYECDYDKAGYDVKAVRTGHIQFPPEFVEMEGWADLLYEYMQSQPSPRAR